MRLILFTILAAFLFVSCNDDDTNGSNEQLAENTKKIIVEEVLQTSNYTYLSGEVNKVPTWIAVSKMDAKKGDTYYYQEGMLMENFVSKELNQTFEKIWFVDHIGTSPEFQNAVDPHHGMPTDMTQKTDMSQHQMKPSIEKGNYSIEKLKDGVTIAELYSKKLDFSGKSIKVKGIVTKVNSQIMDRNWIHIQDGTEHEGEYDLTITSNMTAQEGDTIIVEGILAVDKDFGHGYQYKIILEKAEIK
jgi:hypothetical protein